MKDQKLRKHIPISNLIACLAAAMVALPIALSASPKKDTVETSLIVNIDDFRASLDLDAEWIREDLLERAFYDAARHQKLDGFDLRYNDEGDKDARDYLNLNILHWRRSFANMYEITVSATYYDADGKKIKLGVFHGYRSGIDISMRGDIAEDFADTAEDAFEQAFKKLRKILT